MKKKTYIKEGAYQKVTNTPSKKIKGALDFNKEVLDTLVDKDVIGTTDCCSYFPTIPVLTELANQFPPTAEQIAHLPTYAMFIIEDTTGGCLGCYSIYIKNSLGDANQIAGFG